MIMVGDCLDVLAGIPDETIQTCVTSPPYWGLRDYGVDGQLGLESDPELYIAKLVSIFREVRRVLKDDGTLWLNLGDSYSGGGNNSNNGKPLNSTQGRNRESFRRDKASVIPEIKKVTGLRPKNLVGIPWRVALALQADGWILRQDIIWHKPNPMPESVRDRCTKSHEYIFLLAKNPKYYFDHVSIKEPSVFNKQASAKKGSFGGKGAALKGNDSFRAVTETRNKRSVWTITTKAYKGAHFATFPKDLITPCILAGSKVNDIVLDPFSGAGTTGVVCKELNREYLGIEINPEYAQMAENRIAGVS